MTMSPILSLQGVCKAFASVPVLNGVDLNVAKGQLVCLIGPSGSGKSTLLRCINLLEPIDDGAILFDGQDISMPGLDPQPIRQKIGLVFQNFNLFPHMSAIENVMLAPRRFHRSAKTGVTKQALQQQAIELFVRFGLADHMSYYPDQLSGGQQQRVAIIRALAMNPDIMLFDEVTSALDPELVGEVLDVLSQLAEQGVTMLLATHEMDFAREAADLVCMLDRGQVIERAPPEKLLTDPDHPRTREFLGLD